MKLLVFVSFLLFCITAAAQPRFTDSSFGTNGKVVENTSVPGIDVIDALLQPDGKTLTLATSSYNTINRPVLIRYNTDGTADASFSGDGVADSLIVPNAECNGRAMRLQTDGKILVCGDTGNYYYNRAFAMRYNTSGSLDGTFGASGILYLPTITLNGTSFNLPVVNNLLALSGGKVMLLCTRTVPTTGLVLVRLNNNGMIDSTFGSNGVALINPPGSESGYSLSYTHIEVQTDGKYVVGGSFNRHGYLLVRINVNGTLDNSYGTSGSRLISGSDIVSGLTDMVIQPDNKIIICGPEISYTPHQYTTVFRLTAAGNLDAGFGSSGKQLLYVSSSTGFATLQPQLSLQADGKILVGGMARNSTYNYDMAVTRLTTAGLPDASFDSDGTAVLQPNGYNSYGFVPRQQTDGRILLAGYVRRNDVQAVTISRFNSTGQPDATLNTVASATLLNNGLASESGLNLLLQPSDQKIVSIRERRNAFNYDLCVSRHLPNGKPDSSFGTNGKAYLDMPGDYYEVYSGLSADGKITVIPDLADYVSNGDFSAFRLKADGQPDSSFGMNGKLIFKSINTDTITNSAGYAIVQPDGKILLFVNKGEGTSIYSQRDSIFLLRLNNDGSLDNTLNGNGKKYISTDRNMRMEVQADGKIILENTRLNSAQNGYATYLSRLNANGSTDTTFNNGVTKEISMEASKILVKTDGKILLASYGGMIGRINSNGSLDTSFGGGSINLSAYFRYNNGDDHIYDIKADSNRIVVAGRTKDSITGTHVFKIVALKNNGSVDSTFGQAGVVVSDFFANGYGEQIVVQTDRKIVITGFTENVSNPNLSDFALTRLKSGPLTTGRLYTFTGSGLWSNGANWSEGTVPPTNIPAGSSIVIDPVATGECVIDITVHVQAGASVTVKAGKQVRLPGNLIIQ